MEHFANYPSQIGKAEISVKIHCTLCPLNVSLLSESFVRWKSQILPLTKVLK